MQLSSEFKLNTLFFKPVVPKVCTAAIVSMVWQLYLLLSHIQLYKQFPNSPVALVIDITKYKEIYLDQAGIHISLLGDLSLQVIQENETTFEAFSVELASNHSYCYGCINMQYIASHVYYNYSLSCLQEVHCTIEADILRPNDKPAVMLEATDLQ